jgi:hypothetical protein
MGESRCAGIALGLCGRLAWGLVFRLSASLLSLVWSGITIAHMYDLVNTFVASISWMSYPVVRVTVRTQSYWCIMCA